VDDGLVDHALEQAGCVRVNTMVDAIDHVKILTFFLLKSDDSSTNMSLILSGRKLALSFK
jgi:hypothetical protein